MATFIDLDSTYRLITTYPNPASYIVEANQVSSWNRAPRTVLASTVRPGAKAQEFTQSVEVETCILPYTAITYVDNTNTTINTHTAALQRIYLDVHTLQYNDTPLIQSIDNKVPKARFVLTRKNIQLDQNAVPRWVIFECDMDQVTRFARNQQLKVEFMQEEGYTIVIADTTPTPTKALQTYVCLNITPYFIDAGYDNHALGLTQY